MIPEGTRGGGVYLYRAAAFPYGWARVGKLLKRRPPLRRLVDLFPSRHVVALHRRRRGLGESRSTPVSRGQAYGPLARASFEPDPRGPAFHASGGQSHRGRRHTGTLHPGHYPVYGSSVSAFAVTKLTPTEYQEERVGDAPVLAAGSGAWNRHGMHHIDAHRRADGSVDSVRRRLGLRALKERPLPIADQAPGAERRQPRRERHTAEHCQPAALVGAKAFAIGVPATR